MNKFVLICLPLLGAQFLLTGCGQKEVAEDKSVRSVRAMKVGDIGAWKGRSFPGRASAAQEVDLAFRVTDPLVTLPVKVGDEVEKGWETGAGLVSSCYRQQNRERARGRKVKGGKG